MTGILRGNVALLGRSPEEDLEQVRALGLDGLLFSTVLDLSPTLDPDALAAIKARADALGVRLSAGAGWINPARPERAAEIAALGGGDFRAGLERLLLAGRAIGITTPFFYIGVNEDRFSDDPPWPVQLAQTTEFLAGLAPFLRRHGIVLLAKTHEEITSFEIARIIAAVGEDVLGVALDPVNFLVRGEDPLRATERLARHIRQVHLDDAAVRHAGNGLRRVICPFGTGVIDWPGILALAPEASRWIDMHRGEFDMPYFDAGWLRAQPDMTVAELAAVIGLAARTPDEGVHSVQADPHTRLSPILESLGRLPA